MERPDYRYALQLFTVTVYIETVGLTANDDNSVPVLVLK